MSVPGLIAIHSGATAAGPSSRIGLTLTTATPALASSASDWPMACAPMPPLVTCMFFGLAPPNITISLEWRAIDDHEVSGPVQACALPKTCGRNTSAVPKL